MAQPKGTEIAGRLRAARGYSGLKQPELAAKIGVSADTLGRWERGSGAPERELQDRIAEHCGVPVSFMTVGWEPLREETSEVEERVYALEAALRDLTDEKLMVPHHGATTGADLWLSGSDGAQTWVEVKSYLEQSKRIEQALGAMEPLLLPIITAHRDQTASTPVADREGELVQVVQALLAAGQAVRPTSAEGPEGEAAPDRPQEATGGGVE